MIMDVEMKEIANATPAGDGEMMKKSGIEMVREKFKEWDAWPYQYQFSNKDESPSWCPRVFTIFRDDAGAEGRLFNGTIVEGSENRPVIVKTWDYLMPLRDEQFHRLYKFCDEIELLTDGEANTHPNLVKLYGYCFDRRLAVVYDEDNFGWDEQMKVSTQLAVLLAWLHEKRIAVGSVTAACIMMDDVSLNP
ncbi:hypothetical protein HAX54_011393 [Datura stramonium]|uniref:Protein kinase domain-containing protein n=1 Tax=Datura stramonium TaxID=4076 RepID=A0ABS8TJQ3_DATST|nr:hypothetical protein [Datura stramonium]